MKKRSGQILILVLLVVVVALAVGLSVASRNITNLRTSTQTEQSQRAFSAAEGGVEDVLSRLQTVTSGIPVGGQTTVDVSVGNLTANVLVGKINTYEQVVDEGNVGQIDLKGPPAASGVVQIEWAKTSDTAESSQPATIEVTEVYGTGPYSQARYAYYGVSGRAGESGFVATTGCPTTEFVKCTRITPNLNSQLLRIRPFWNKTTIRVSSVSGSLPAQTYNITSTAKTPSGITRKVNVTRTALPQLPASFDYVLFSESDIVK